MLETAEAPKQAFNSDEENPAFVPNLDENSKKSDNQEIASGLK